MAIQLQIQAQVRATGSTNQTNGLLNPVNITIAGELQSAATQLIGTATHEELTPSALSTPGCIVIQNVDDANYVEIGTDSSNDGLGTFSVFARLYPSGSGVNIGIIGGDGAKKWFARANTAAVLVNMQVYQR